MKIKAGGKICKKEKKSPKPNKLSLWSKVTAPEMVVMAAGPVGNLWGSWGGCSGPWAMSGGCVHVVHAPSPSFYSAWDPVGGSGRAIQTNGAPASAVPSEQGEAVHTQHCSGLSLLQVGFLPPAANNCTLLLPKVPPTSKQNSRKWSLLITAGTKHCWELPGKKARRWRCP